MGGVWIGNNTTDHPTLWQRTLPPDITTSLVTYENPPGTISNSDLELVGHVAHNNVLASIADIDRVTVASYTDNTTALYWTKKGSTSTSVPAAYLLWLQALHQQKYCYHSRTAHIAGSANVMADDCSRLWHLTDEQLLTHFNLHYPQSLPWQQCTLRPEMTSTILSALQGSNNLRSCSCHSYKDKSMVPHLAGQMYRVGDQPHPRSQYNPHL